MSTTPQPSASADARVQPRRAQNPGILAAGAPALLLIAFFVQCFWLMSHVPLSQAELNFIGRNLTAQNQAEEQPEAMQDQAPGIQGGAPSAGEMPSGMDRMPAARSGVAQEPAAQPALAGSPLVTALANAPLYVVPREANLNFWEWLFRLPFAVTGLLLGASLWYIARRQFGEAAGYISLALYCFSPLLIARMSSVGPDALTAWGGFGSVYAALAAAHTLYAPRAGVLWNRKRILLLGIGLGIAVAAQLSTAIFVPIALAYMLYLVPERWGATLAIVSLACFAALGLVLTTYEFHFGALAGAASKAHLFHLSSGLFTSFASWKMLALFLLSSSPGIAVLLAVAIFALAAWPKICFFGTFAPLLTAIILIFAGISLPHAAGFSFLVVALPFLILFIAAVFADLLQGRHRPVFLGVLWAVLLSHAAYSLIGLAQITR